MNDNDLDIVARNTILLMIAQQFETEEAVPAMIHLWYSARLPTAMLEMIQDKLLPMVEDVCTKIVSKADNVPLAKTFKLESGSSLRVVLTKPDWNRFKAYFTVPEGLTFEEIETMRGKAVYDPARRDYYHKGMYTYWPSLRMCADKFRRDGIFLPYGSSRNKFVAWNPTFLQNPGLWPMRDDVDVHCGWSHEDILSGAPGATNDYAGAQFNMMRELLTEFCERAKKMNVHFRMYFLDCRVLPARLVQWEEDTGLYDRIEVNLNSHLLCYPLH
jgi:hypothetical protein